MERKGPWCFTTDKNIRFQYCSIPLCGTPQEEAGDEIPEEVEEKKVERPVNSGCYNISDAGRSYVGPKTTDGLGEECLFWKEHGFTQFDDNFCRNPIEGGPAEPWCFCGQSKAKCLCKVPACEVKKEEIEKIPTKCQVKTSFSSCMTETIMTGSCEMTTEMPNGCTIAAAQLNQETYEVLITAPGQEGVTEILKTGGGNKYESKSCGTVILENTKSFNYTFKFAV